MQMDRRLLQGRMSRRQTLLGMAGAIAVPALGGLRPFSAAAQDVTLTLVAYSTPREAYEALIPLFQATPEGDWRAVRDLVRRLRPTRAGRSRAASPADVVALSLEPDVTRLIEAGLVAEDWNADEHNGMVTDSVVVLVFRPGNPKGIAGWDDLIKEGVEVITPNPSPPVVRGGTLWPRTGAQLEAG